ncbi:MAG: Sua5/YciO/YrdC/YwlC family protein [Oleispira sp.]|nr:Sua5/YciO/YrdC/YwlC family protein [Oleispira sp.]
MRNETQRMEIPLAVINVGKDAKKVFTIAKEGGIAIGPVDTGYSILGGCAGAVRKINQTKGRGGHKRNAMLGSMDIHREVHILDRRKMDMIEAITQDFDLPVAVIAPYREDHPLIRGLDEEMLKTSTALGNVCMLLNAGSFLGELAKLSLEASHPILGSSANLTGTGTKWRVEDIQPEITAIADVIVDYGVRKYYPYRRAGTLINFETMEVMRIGVCYDSIAGVLRRHFQVDLPPDPGIDALPSGHLDEFALADVS